MAINLLIYVFSGFSVVLAHLSSAWNLGKVVSPWGFGSCSLKYIFPLILGGKMGGVRFGDGVRGKTAFGISVGIKAPLCKWF